MQMPRPQQWLGAYDLAVAIITVQALADPSRRAQAGGVGQQLGQGVTPVGGQER